MMTKKGLYFIIVVCVVFIATGCRKAGNTVDLDAVLRQEKNWEDDSPFQEKLESPAKSENAENPGGTTASGQTEFVWVHICGEVLFPGVYEMEAESRVYDVLMAAGGFTELADERSVNLAAVVLDAMQVVIPSVKEETPGEEENGLININTATREQLATLPGIGEARASDIILYREEHGRFQKKEDVMKVKGIKQAAFEKIKDKITTG